MRKVLLSNSRIDQFAIVFTKKNCFVNQISTNKDYSGGLKK